MIRSYILVALRSLKRNRLHAAINIIGLSIGMACCILITLFVQFELSYDKHNDRAERIYRMVVNLGANNWAISAFPIGPLIEENFAEVEAYTRIKPSEIFVANNERDLRFKEKVFFADSSVFDVLRIKLLKGDPATALAGINSMVITPERAKIYFGEEEPVGKTLILMNDNIQYKITGVFEPLPSASHVHMDIMVSSENFGPMRPNSPQGWQFYTSHYTYLVLAPGTDPIDLEKRIATFMREFQQLGPDDDQDEVLLQAMTSIHLHSNRGLEIENNGNMNTVYIMGAIAFFILVIACINFMNLTTAQSLKRAREVGIRKVVGSKRVQLVFQFLSESVLISFIALALSVLILLLVTPTFNEISNKEIVLNPLRNGSVALLLLGITFFVGVFAGTYPAFVISNFSPTVVLKGKFISNIKGRLLRQGLVVFQFAVAFVIMVGTYVIYSQIDYMLGKDMGFDRDQVLVLTMPRDSVGDQSVKNEMQRLNGVASVTRFGEMPGYMVWTSTFWYEGVPDNEPVNLYHFTGDVDLLSTLGIALKAGSYFSETTTRYGQEFVLNETAIKRFGWTPEEAIGKQFNFGGRGDDPGKVIGVIEDFHFKHLHEKIDPLVLHLQPNYEGQFMALKINTADLSEVVGEVEKTWKALLPQYDFEFEFLDKRFEQLFDQEQRLGQLFGIFSGLAIFISCLGLFGLASFTMEESRKSVAIRKVLGASVASILVMMSRDFLKLVLIGMLIAAPLAWYAMDQWLQGFAYNAGFAWIVFVYAAAVGIAVAMLTVSYHSLRAATTNPVNSLKEQS
jgi:putative ABC transport system permease protein